MEKRIAFQALLLLQIVVYLIMLAVILFRKFQSSKMTQCVKVHLSCDFDVITTNGRFSIFGLEYLCFLYTVV